MYFYVYICKVYLLISVGDNAPFDRSASFLLILFILSAGIMKSIVTVSV